MESLILQPTKIQADMKCRSRHKMTFLKYYIRFSSILLLYWMRPKFRKIFLVSTLKYIHKDTYLHKWTNKH